MIYLVLSILSSSLIFVIFRIFPKLKVDTFQAIVFNYFTACLSGFLLYGKDFKSEALSNTSWIPFVFICGILFISLFLVMGISSQKNGVAITSVSVKMSMAMTMILMILWYDEQITILKISGILLAILGVLLMTWTGNQAKSDTKPIVWMLILLFIGSGGLDFSLNYVQENFDHIIPASLFSAIGFGIAGTIGTIILLIQIARKKTRFAFRNVIAGIALGIPNYFSIFLLMKSYKTMEPWSDTTVLAITNVSIVVLSAFYGFVLFKEKFSQLKAFALLASISAIVTLYLASV